MATALTVVNGQNFKFTSPSTDTALNLSAPIHITWDQGVDKYAQVDLRWQGQTTTGTGFAYTIKENVTTSDGQFTWDPTNTSKALQSTSIRLTSGRDFNFYAKLHEVNKTSGAGVSSDGYTITGYPLIGNAALPMRPSAAVVVFAGVLSLSSYYL